MGLVATKDNSIFRCQNKPQMDRSQGEDLAGVEGAEERQANGGD